MRKKTSHPSPDAKIVIYTRIDPATVAALDVICEQMRPKPTRAQLIDAALAEYVERHAHEAQEREMEST
jgi:predicted transcriptional regulator